MSEPKTYYVIKFDSGGYYSVGGLRHQCLSRLGAYALISRPCWAHARVVKVTRKPRQVFKAIVRGHQGPSQWFTRDRSGQNVDANITIYGAPDFSRPMTLRVRP